MSILDHVVSNSEKNRFILPRLDNLEDMKALNDELRIVQDILLNACNDFQTLLANSKRAEILAPQIVRGLSMVSSLTASHCIFKGDK
jgi:hypothetical protein